MVKNKKINLKVINYAGDFRKDFMDVYLAAKCKLFVSIVAHLSRHKDEFFIMNLLIHADHSA